MRLFSKGFLVFSFIVFMFVLSACGADSAEIEFQTSDSHLQWRYVGDDEWIDLIELDELKGADGVDGVDGTDGADGADGAPGADGSDGADGASGADGTDGVDGMSAFEIYLHYFPGYDGDEKDWIIEVSKCTLPIVLTVEFLDGYYEQWDFMKGQLIGENPYDYDWYLEDTFDTVGTPDIALLEDTTVYINRGKYINVEEVRLQDDGSDFNPDTGAYEPDEDHPLYGYLQFAANLTSEVTGDFVLKFEDITADEVLFHFEENDFDEFDRWLQVKYVYLDEGAHTEDVVPVGNILRLTMELEYEGVTYTIIHEWEMSEAMYQNALSTISIVDVALSDPDFSVLVELLVAADLVDVLAGYGTFTVFAPTNDAFDALLIALDIDIDDLKDNMYLTDILLYHVLPDIYMAADVVAAAPVDVTTVGGMDVSITLDNGSVLVNDSEVIATDITANNGVIHVIDAVLVPFDPLMESVASLWADIPANEEEVTILATVVAKTDRGYILQDHSETDLVSFWHTAGVLDVGDRIRVTAEWRIAFRQNSLRAASDILVISKDNPINADTSNASTINWTDYDGRTDYENGQLVMFDGFWARFAGTGNTSYLRLGHTEADVDDQSYGGNYIGFQNGANNMNLSQTLADLFPEAIGVDAHTHYEDVVIYAFLYDGSASYDKFVILADAHIHIPLDNIPTTAIKADDFDVLVEALVEADLVGALEAEGPFTVFAPTDDAFGDLLTELDITKEQLLELDTLSDILLYHVVAGAYTAEDVIALTADGPVEVETLNGQYITLSVVEGSVYVNDSKVILADVEASNGWIHVIDAVLLPEAE